MSTWQPFAIVAGVAIATYLALITALVATGRRTDARALAGFIPDSIVLMKRLMGDERVSRSRKLLLAAVIGYLAMPFDVVPDFVPVIGQLDDLIVVALALRAVLRTAGFELLREHWPGPDTSLRVVEKFADV